MVTILNWNDIESRDNTNELVQVFKYHFDDADAKIDGKNNTGYDGGLYWTGMSAQSGIATTEA